MTVLANYEKVRDIFLPTLGPERRATYSAVPADLPTLGPRAASADPRMECHAGTIVYEE